jgi:hypothetical protein
MKPPTFAARVSLITGMLIIVFGAAFGGVASNAIQRTRHTLEAPAHSMQMPAFAGDSATFAYWLPASIFGALGLLLAGIGTFTMIRGFRQLTDRRWLAEHGVRIVAGSLTVERTMIGTTSNLPSARPYVIVACWRNPRDGKQWRFVSDPMLIDPQASLAQRQTVGVLIDANDPGRYWLDTGFLPPAPAMLRGA